MSDTKPAAFHFTVAQLIEVLKTLPPDLPVLVSGYENGYENFYNPKITKLKHEPDNMYYDGQFQIVTDLHVSHDHAPPCALNAEENGTGTFDAVILDREFRDD